MKHLISIILAGFIINSYASSNDLSIAQITNRFTYNKVQNAKVYEYFHKLLPSTTINNIYDTPYKGIYVLQAGKNVFYGQVNSPFLIVGHMFNPYSQQDITADINSLVADSSRVDLTKIDVSNAIVQKGKNNPDHKKIIVFEDPDCPYCRMLESQLEKSGLMDKLDIYKILIALPMHPNSKQHVTNIYCSSDKIKVLENYMVKNQDNQKINISSTCSATAILDSNEKLARSLDINGTPTIILGNGQLIQGMDMAKIADYATSNQLNKQINNVVKGK